MHEHHEHGHEHHEHEHDGHGERGPIKAAFFITAFIALVEIVGGLLTGSLALLMVIYGGTIFIIAAGSQERIQKAKQILVAASIGVAIIFSAWLIVNIVIGTLTSGTIHSEAKIFDRIWSEAPSG